MSFTHVASFLMYQLLVLFSGLVITWGGGVGGRLSII